MRSARLGSFGAGAKSRGCRCMEVRSAAGRWKSYKGSIYVYMSYIIIGN